MKFPNRSELLDADGQPPSPELIKARQELAGAKAKARVLKSEPAKLTAEELHKRTQLLQEEHAFRLKYGIGNLPKETDGE